MIKFNRDFIFEWACTATLIAGVALTSFNIYPLNLWVSLVGNLGWLLLGWIWRKWSLIIVETVISAIYIVGIVDLYLLK
jgi:hypothetical protein